MKKIFLTLAGSLFVSMAILAQERSDTTGTQTNDPSTNYRTSETGTREQESGVQSESDTMQGKSATQGQSMDWSDADRESVSRESLPSDLVETLKSEEYQGWENATIYRNKVSDDYMLVIQDNGSTRTFYFDKEGQPHKYNSGDDQGSSSSASQSGTSDSGSIQSGATQSETTQSGSSESGTMQSETTESGTTASGNTQSSGTTESGTDASSGSQATTGSENQTSQENPNNSNATGATSTSSGTTTPSGASGSTLGEQPSTSGTATTEQPSSVGTGSTDQSTTISTEQPSTSWRAEDRAVIMSSDIPASLRVTLDDDTYKGWENSTIYRNRQSNEYMIEIRDGSNSKIYYFDKDGKALQISGPEDN